MTIVAIARPALLLLRGQSSGVVGGGSDTRPTSEKEIFMKKIKRSDCSICTREHDSPVECGCDRCVGGCHGGNAVKVKEGLT